MQFTTVLILTLSVGLVELLKNKTTNYTSSYATTIRTLTTIRPRTTKGPTTTTRVMFKESRPACCSEDWVICSPALAEILDKAYSTMDPVDCRQLKTWFGCVEGRSTICALADTSKVEAKVAEVNKNNDCSFKLKVDDIRTTTLQTELTSQSHTVGPVTTQETTTKDYLPSLPSVACDEEELDACIYRLKDLMRSTQSIASTRFQDNLCEKLRDWKNCAGRPLIYCGNDKYKEVEEIHTLAIQKTNCSGKVPSPFYKESREREANCIRNVIKVCEKIHTNVLVKQYSLNNFDATIVCRMGKWRADCLNAGLKGCKNAGGDISDDVLDGIQNKCNKDKEPIVLLTGGASRYSFMTIWSVLGSIVSLMKAY